MQRYVLDIHEIDRSHVAIAGGKAANLGELSRIGGIHVPAGVVVTTRAYQRALGSDAISMPREVADEIGAAVTRLGEDDAYAVRSSATAEDSPTASFAGQFESYLGISGLESILEHVTKCWRSLFSERAASYRRTQALEISNVSMAVIVQRMVSPRVSGVLFTADPVTGNRKIACVEAVPGLGDALVSGRANADAYRVRGDEIIERHGGALTDAQILRLAQLGRRIEAHFGRPQDIEWCLENDDFQFVQARPITTLFPVPVTNDAENHVYLSTGHQQMMTDAMTPLGISIWRMGGAATFHEAGGRLFVDVARALAVPASREALLDMVRKSDALTADALQTILDRGFIRPVSAEAGAPPPVRVPPPPIETDPAIVAGLIERSQASISALKRDIASKTGPALFEFILEDIPELKRILTDPQSHQAIMAGIEATWWLNEHLRTWLGETNAADTLTLSAPNNVTSEMGLALLDLADVIRPHAGVVKFLRETRNDDFLNELPALPGGRDARDAIAAWLERYGMRGPGEIDVARPRWSERPTMLLPLLVGHIENFAAGEATRRFEEGRRKSAAKEQELLERLRALPDGSRRAEETKRMIDRVRTFIGYREYPKYALISRYFVYKHALMREADRLVERGVIMHNDDIFYLTFPELHDVVRTQRVDADLIRRRKAEFRAHQALTPPRVLTSDGEMLTGSYRRGDVPTGALVGLAVSAGTVEGRARVVLDFTNAKLETGDILVTRFTDPSWTPLFVTIKGLVTEVGGLMTHGAVIAREYGLPAVVGVERATEVIRDGQQIRINGTDGYVEILASPAGAPQPG